MAQFLYFRMAMSVMLGLTLLFYPVFSSQPENPVSAEANIVAPNKNETISPSDWPVRNNFVATANGLGLAGFRYTDFGAPAGLTILGDASLINSRLRLTPSQPFVTGAAWHVARQYVADGFFTTFTFQINDVVSNGADGFAFVIQNDDAAIIGGGGGSMGYSFIRNSLSVEFDTNQNIDIGDPSNNHISIMTRRGEPADANHNFALATTSAIPDMSDGAPHIATISYSGGALKVWLDGSATPALSQAINLSSILNSSDGYAWVGFTSATGAAWENHDILSWSFTYSTTGQSVVDEADTNEWTPAMQDSLDSAAQQEQSRTELFAQMHESPETHLPHVPLSPVSSGSSNQMRNAPDKAIQPIPATHPPKENAANGIRTVVTTANSGSGSLRAAMEAATAGDVIRFDVGVFSPSSPATILISSSALPDINAGNITIDASDAGVILDGQLLTEGNGLSIRSNGNVVKGLQIIRFPGNGIVIAGNAAQNTIGGDSALGRAVRGEGNIITNNGGSGVLIVDSTAHDNTVVGNLIGLDADGTYPVRIQDLAISPNFGQDRTLFAATRFNGTLKSTDAGATWSEVNSGMGITNVLTLSLSPAYANDHTLYAGTFSGGIYRSQDGGASWQKMRSIERNRKAIAIKIAPDFATSRQVFAIEHAIGIIFSQDAGLTWESRIKGLSVPWELNNLSISPNYANDGTVFAVAWNSIFRTTDRGLNWSQVLSGYSGFRFVAVSPTYATDHTLFAAIDTCTDPSVSLLKSTNGGTTWVPVTTSLVTCGLRAAVFSPAYVSDQTMLVSDEWRGIMRTTDGGATWTWPKQVRATRSMSLSPSFLQDGKVYAAQFPGQILVSTDRGANWSAIAQNLTEQGNAEDGVRVTNGANHNTIGGTSAGKRNIISNNKLVGIGIWAGGADGNTIMGNYIGTDVTGMRPLGNIAEGMVVESSNNLIGGDTSAKANVISANGFSGMSVRKTTGAYNTVQGNIVGLNATSNGALGNGEHGIMIPEGATHNQILKNIVSANADMGIGVYNASNYTTISGNIIGSDISGDAILGNYDNGVSIASESSFAQIGGASYSERNLISNNGGRGIVIWNTGVSHNTVIGNYIGVDMSGANARGNQLEGVLLAGEAHNNRIGGNGYGERNVVAASGWYGIAMWNSSNNTVAGNFVGTDASGTRAIGNNHGILMADGASNNTVGGSSAGNGNLISGNKGTGVYLNGTATKNNIVAGNLIGTNLNGSTALGNGEVGLILDAGANLTRVGGTTALERNIISGNRVYGISLRNDGPADSRITNNNTIIGNYIGLDATGTKPIGNGATGITFENMAAGNRIGGTTAAERNVIAASLWDGIGFWGTGAVSNTVTGNYIGTNANGTSPIPNNGAGVAFINGAQYNRVGGASQGEGNLISGNVDGGALLVGANTAQNTIIGNWMGADASGKLPLSNRYGVSCRGQAHDNWLLNNVIGGNTYSGVHLDGCSNNFLSGNSIGISQDGVTPLSNGENGINLYDGSSGNQIGFGNIIAYNRRRGISIWDAGSVRNSIQGNSIFGNIEVGIKLGNGGNHEIAPPVISSASADTVVGSAGKVNAGIEVFSGMQTQGQVYEGVTTSRSNGGITFSDPSRINGPAILATLTDGDGSTSEFSAPFYSSALNCLPKPRYEALKTQARAAYPGNIQSRINYLISLLNNEWNLEIGREWQASSSASYSLDAGYLSVSWMDTSANLPVADPAGNWSAETDFSQGTWGAFLMRGKLRLFNSGRSARLCNGDSAILPTSVSISGPSSGSAGTAYRFSASLAPIGATPPFTYVWQATDISSVSHVNIISDGASLAWATPGTKIVQLTATSARGASVTAQKTINIGGAPSFSWSGYAVSAPQPLPSGQSWGAITITANLPAGAMGFVSLLTVDSQPIIGWGNHALMDGQTTWNLGGLSVMGISAFRIRIDFSTSNPLISPSLTNWTLGYFNGVSDGADSYEPDDACGNARNIPSDGSFQNHTFHRLGDVDWIVFHVISGTEYVITGQVPDDSQTNLEVEYYAGCNGALIDSQGYAFSPGVRLQNRFDFTGLVYLRFHNQDPALYGSNYFYEVSVMALSPAPSAGALIIAGGAINNDGVRRNISDVVSSVYQLFNLYSYPTDRIYVLSPYSDQPYRNAPSTKENLHYAITVWANARVDQNHPLNLYLVDHGGGNVFYLDERIHETVTPDEINAWLNEVESAHPGLRVNIFIEACYSGSFISLPGTISKPGRVIVASTNDSYLAFADPQGGAFFSNAFISNLKRGESIYAAYSLASSSTKSRSRDQQPWLDDNGDGITDAKDGLEAAKRGFSYSGSLGNPLYNWPPYVQSASAFPSAQEGTFVINAEALDDSLVRHVWATIYPPSYRPPLAGTTLISETLQTTLLNPAGGNNFSGAYPGFTQNGAYRLVITAEDNEGVQGQPRVIYIYVGPRIYLPAISK